jgi:hypothetical protein
MLRPGRYQLQAKAVGRRRAGETILQIEERPVEVVGLEPAGFQIKLGSSIEQRHLKFASGLRGQPPANDRDAAGDALAPRGCRFNSAGESRPGVCDNRITHGTQLRTLDREPPIAATARRGRQGYGAGVELVANQQPASVGQRKAMQEE